MLMRSATQSLTEQLAERFAARIRDRLLAPGSRLPSVRQCATQHQLSPSTVVAAYDQLLAQGLVERGRKPGLFCAGLDAKTGTSRSADGSPSAIEAGVSDGRPGWRGWRRRSTPRR
jgi:DNA-binding transcriptional regulator YhcF (GntR family)